jgi:hypothetical protein
MSFPEANAPMEKPLKRSWAASFDRPRDAYLRDHLWIFVRVMAVVALIAIVAFLVHAS